jgi:quercetin dioxygenase-like cupin family protein
MQCRPFWKAAPAGAIAMLAALLAGAAEDDMHVVMPADIQWVDNTSVPRGMQSMFVYGDPTKPGPFIFRAKFRPNYTLPPHRHPDDRTVTVISGTYFSGIGETFDPARLKAFPPGSFYFVRGGVPHFSATREGEVIIQESGAGPGSGIEYVHPEDDPRPR